MNNSEVLNIVFDVIDKMENDIKSEWNYELYKSIQGYESEESAEYCMDILEGKAVILSQLKDRLYDMMNSDECHIDSTDILV